MTLLAVAQKLNGQFVADAEELTKNFSGAPCDVSISDFALLLNSNTQTITSGA